ncbi:MAG: BON domain-containing protein [Pirellulaceae bacterium]|jgi:hypothetical protein|nr:BON domain-containing protein [Pirellulaceae bacterium]
MRLQQNRVGICLAIVGLVLLGNQESKAQFGAANTSTFGNSENSGQSSGAFEQTGSISSEAAINRGSGFVGGDSSDTFNLRNAPTTSAAGGTSARGMSGMSGMSGRGRGGTGGTNGRGTQQTTGRTVLRFPFVIGFQVPRVPAPVIKASVEQRLTKLPGLKAGNAVVIKIEKDTAILNGTAVDAQQSNLIAKLMLLEPGVYKVRNELVVKKASK